MDGFKSLPKMQCFREGGAVKSKPVAKCSGGKMKEGGKADLAQDKKVIKKAFKMHDAQEHKGEKTDLSTLKKGGRTKKAVGTVKKFACGGGVYGAKKTEKDLKSIKEAKDCKPTKAKAPSGAKGPDAFKKGGKVKKMQVGGSVLAGQGAVSDAERKSLQTVAKSSGQGQMSDYERNRASNINKLSPAQQSEFAKQQSEATAKYGKKKGGKVKVKKFAEGGSTGPFSAEEESWLGGADRTDPYILARMRSALGPKKAAPVAAAPSAAIRPDPAMIEDESGRGNVTAAQQIFNQEVPGSGINTAVTPSAPVRPMRRPQARPPVIEDESQRGIVTPAQKEFNKSIPGSGSAPYISIPTNNPGMKQFGTGESPLGGMFNRFFNASPSDQADQFRRSAEQRKKVGKNIGNTLGINKPSEG